MWTVVIRLLKILRLIEILGFFIQLINCLNYDVKMIRLEYLWRLKFQSIIFFENSIRCIEEIFREIYRDLLKNLNFYNYNSFHSSAVLSEKQVNHLYFIIHKIILLIL